MKPILIHYHHAIIPRITTSVVKIAIFSPCRSNRDFYTKKSTTFFLPIFTEIIALFSKNRDFFEKNAIFNEKIVGAHDSIVL